MLVSFRHPKPANRVPFEIEFHQNGGLVADNPTVVPGLNRNHLRSDKFQHATVGVFDMHSPAGQKADVSMHAQIRAGDALHMGRPAKSHGVDHSLHAAGARSDDIELEAANVAVVAAGDGREADQLRA